ncbi:MAG: CDP-alcohol phosphatidyltransferase family protein, partial [Spirochaetales bacterium]
ICGIFFLFQTIFYTAVMLVSGLTPRLSFYLLCLLLHTVLLLALLKLSPMFVKIPDQVPLERINSANALTLFRLSSLVSICYFILPRGTRPGTAFLAVYLALVFLTDLLDGFLARKLKETTKIGAIMDSTSDYALLILMATAYAVFSIIPLWLYLLIMARLLFQGCLMLVLWIRRKKLEPEPTFLGKAAVFAVMVLFGFEFFKVLHIGSPLLTAGIIILEVAVSGIITASFIDKILWFSGKIKKIR